MSQIFTSDFKWDVYKDNKNGRSKFPLELLYWTLDKLSHIPQFVS